MSDLNSLPDEACLEGLDEEDCTGEFTPRAAEAMKAPIFRKMSTEVPNPKQILFYKSKVKHTAYGGARGGGKSYAPYACGRL